MIALLCEWVVLCSDTKLIGAADILPLFCDITEFPIYFTLGSLKKQFSSSLISYENFVGVQGKTNESYKKWLIQNCVETFILHRNTGAIGYCSLLSVSIAVNPL